MANVGADLASRSDEKAIRSVVREYGATWNRHNMAALAELFADDAHWINIVGMHWRDKSAVVTGHQVYHRTFFQGTEIELADVEIRPIAADAAVAIVLLKVGPFTPPDGVHRPKSENRLSLMLARRDGRWLIAHGHNTVIDLAAQPFDPVNAGWPQQGRKPA